MYEIAISYTILVCLENPTCSGEETLQERKLEGIDR